MFSQAVTWQATNKMHILPSRGPPPPPLHGGGWLSLCQSSTDDFCSRKYKASVTPCHFDCSKPGSR